MILNLAVGAPRPGFIVDALCRAPRRIRLRAFNADELRAIPAIWLQRLWMPDCR